MLTFPFLTLPSKTKQLPTIEEQPTRPMKALGTASYRLIVMKLCTCGHLADYGAVYCGGCGGRLTNEEQTATI